MLKVLDVIIDHPVLGNKPGKGLSIGNLTSQHFANLYLGQLDHFLKEKLKIKGYLRYVDDFIAFSDSKQELHGLLIKIQEFLANKLKLDLKEKVTIIAPVDEGIPFLGFRIYPRLIRIQGKNLSRFRKKFLKTQKSFRKGEMQTDQFIQSINSMISHISHGDTVALRRKEFGSFQGVV